MLENGKSDDKNCDDETDVEMEEGEENVFGPNGNSLKHKIDDDEELDNEINESHADDGQEHDKRGNDDTVNDNGDTDNELNNDVVFDEKDNDEADNADDDEDDNADDDEDDNANDDEDDNADDDDPESYDTDDPNGDVLEIIRSNKGGDKLCYKEHMYIWHRLNKNDIRWRCVKHNHKDWKCKGALTTTLNTSHPTIIEDHNHVCDSQLINKDKAMNRMKAKAKLDLSAKPCQIFAEEVHEIPKSTQARLPAEISVKRTLRNQRLKNIPPDSGLLEELIIEGDWMMTGGAESQRFLLNDNGPIGTDERVIIFATDTLLELLADAAAWYMDGNFDLAPQGFTQLYVLRVSINGGFVTVAYALLQRKNQATYVHLLKTIMDKCAAIGVYPDPQAIHIDFEKAVINAIREVLGHDIKIQGCFFHLTQATSRKVQELGLVDRYKKNEKFNRFCGMIDGLAFLPVEDVSKGMSYLEQICSTKAKPLFTYFDETYVKGVGLKVRRVSPQFPPVVWNVHDATVNGEARTNNSTEGWNNRFATLVGISHPTIWKLIQKMRLEVSADNTKLAQIHRDRNKASTKPSKIEDRQNTLQNLCTAYDDGTVNINNFLTQVSDTIRFRKI